MMKPITFFLILTISSLMLMSLTTDFNMGINRVEVYYQNNTDSTLITKRLTEALTLNNVQYYYVYHRYQPDECAEISVKTEFYKNGILVGTLYGTPTRQIIDRIIEQIK
jgi:hypothetical protein